MTKKDYDVIVIGGGINGLTTAAYLAKAGLSVDLFEARGQCGALRHDRARPVRFLAQQPLNNPEKITMLTAGLMYYITKIFAPVGWFLSASTKLLLSLTGIKKNPEPPVSEEELKSLLETGTLHGTFEKEESEMIKKIFSVNDKKVSDIMVRRMDIEWIDSSMTNEEIFQFISTHHYSKYVVAKNDMDHFQGILYSKEFLINYHNNPSFDLNSIISEALIVPDSIYSIDLFERFGTVGNGKLPSFTVLVCPVNNS